MRGVEEGYPFYGTLKLGGDVPFSHHLLRDRGALVAPELLTQLGTTVGGQLRIGGEPFVIRGTIAQEPGRRIGAFSFGARVLVSLADLRATGLLAFGSRATYEILLKMDDPGVTQPGLIAGTPAYMSPEQSNGEHVDHRSDLFSLGSVLYALCTGHAPFRATTTMAVLKQVCEHTPRPVRDINPDIPDWLEALITALHSKDPARRPQTAAEVAKRLGQGLADLQQPTQPAVPRETTRRSEPTRRPAFHWLPTIGAAMLVYRPHTGLTPASAAEASPSGTLTTALMKPASVSFETFTRHPRARDGGRGTRLTRRLASANECRGR